jgi:Tfp pilus assembly protein PilV
MSRQSHNPPDRVRARDDSGVGITEVLIALVIFSGAILGIVGTAARVGGIMSSSQLRLKAANEAAHQVEELLTMPYDSVASGTIKREGIEVRWTVTETSVAKEVALVYGYDLPSGTQEDTLSAAVLKP